MTLVWSRDTWERWMQLSSPRLFSTRTAMSVTILSSEAVRAAADISLPPAHTTVSSICSRTTWRNTKNQCCRSGIRCFFDPVDTDLGFRIGEKSGSRNEHPRLFSESLKQFLGLNILKFFDADPGSGIFLTLDPGWKNSYSGSGIKIPGSQHCLQYS